jgi:hypothetical protein
MEKSIKLTRNNFLVEELCKDALLDFDSPRNVGVVVCGNEKYEDVKVGDKVFFGETNGYMIELNGIRYCLLSYSEMLGIIEGECGREDIIVGRYRDLDDYIDKLTQKNLLGDNPINIHEGMFYK